MKACLLLADKAFDANEQIITLLANQNKAVVIPPKSSCKIPRDYGREIYKARHLSKILRQTQAIQGYCNAVMTKPTEISSPATTWPQQPFGLIDDRP